MSGVVSVFTTLCWIALALYWVVSARSVKPVEEQEIPAGRLRHVPLLVISFVLLFAFDHATPVYPFSIVLLPRSIGTGIAGAVACVLGLAGALWARRTLAGNWSGAVTFKKGHELIQNGPYRFVRHPIYTSILLMFLGTAFAIGRLAGFLGLAILLVAYWTKLRREETLMARHFPAEYAAYRKRVKALIPFVL